MGFQRRVYTLGDILGMTGMVGFATAVIYSIRHKQPTLVWFIENWGLYIGIGCTVLTFLYGLTILGTPWYDEETNKRLKFEHDLAVHEWNSKSPEERAIINAARQNELLELTQIMQNNTIIRNQERLKKKM
jgi:low affinity Fe/Cu permease